MIQAPCLDCLDRKIYCHSNCSKYKEYRETMDMINTKKSEVIMMNLYVEQTINRFSGKAIGER